MIFISYNCFHRSNHLVEPTKIFIIYSFGSSYLNLVVQFIILVGSFVSVIIYLIFTGNNFFNENMISDIAWGVRGDIIWIIMAWFI